MPDPNRSESQLAVAAPENGRRKKSPKDPRARTWKSRNRRRGPSTVPADRDPPSGDGGDIPFLVLVLVLVLLRGMKEDDQDHE